jgi:hypothetical protein
MMTNTDTSAEAVERLAADAEARADMYSVQHGIGARNARETAATLRALLAERDEAQRNARAWQSAAHTAGQYREQERSRVEKAEAERDRLREALGDIERITMSQCFDATSMAKRMREIARAALKETGHE